MYPPKYHKFLKLIQNLYFLYFQKKLAMMNLYLYTCKENRLIEQFESFSWYFHITSTIKVPLTWDRTKLFV